MYTVVLSKSKYNQCETVSIDQTELSIIGNLTGKYLENTSSIPELERFLKTSAVVIKLANRAA